MWGVGDGYPELSEPELERLCHEAVTVPSSHGGVYKLDSPFHLAEDLYADRTVKIEVLDAHGLKDEVVADLQRLLADRWPLWRILLCCEGRTTCPPRSGLITRWSRSTTGAASGR